MVAVAVDLWPPSYFVPSQLTGLQLWLDASDSGTLFQDSGFSLAATSNGDPVGGWRDKSGNGRHATQSGASRPTLLSSALNGKSAVDFNAGSAQYLNLASAEAWPNASYFAVARVDDTAGFKMLIGGALDAHGMLFNNAEAAIISKCGGPNVCVAASASTADAVYAHAYDDGASGAVLRRNGVDEAGSVSAQSSMIGLVNLVGARNGGANDRFDGRIYELAAYGRVLLSAEVAQVEAYLKAKWGL